MMRQGKGTAVKAIKSISETSPARLAVLESFLKDAVESWPEFDDDESVNGGDLVEWFAQWRADVISYLRSSSSV